MRGGVSGSVSGVKADKSNLFVYELEAHGTPIIRAQGALLHEAQQIGRASCRERV